MIDGGGTRFEKDLGPCESWQQKLNIATQRNGVIKLHPSKADIKFVVLKVKFTAQTKRVKGLDLKRKFTIR